MAYDKRIITYKVGNNETHDEYTYCNCIVMAQNHYRHDIAFLNALAKEAKRDFPHLTDEDLVVFKVTKSRYNEGFWGVIFSLPVGTTKESYRHVSELDFSCS